MFGVPVRTLSKVKSCAVADAFVSEGLRAQDGSSLIVWPSDSHADGDELGRILWRASEEVWREGDGLRTGQRP